MNLHFPLFNLVTLDKLAIQALLTLFQKMAPANLTCRIRVEKAESNDGDNGQSQEVATFPLRDCPDIGIEIRTRWTTEVMKHFEQTGKPHTGIRPRDFVARLDGSIESLTMPVLEGDPVKAIPLASRYRRVLYTDVITMKKSEEPKCSRWLVCSTRSCPGGSLLRD